MTIETGKLKTLWILAAVGGVAAGLGAGAFAYWEEGLDAGWLIAGIIALGIGVYIRAVLLASLVWFFARELVSYLGDTGVDREGDSVSVTPQFRLSGDAALDEYIASFAGAYAKVVKSLVWVLIIATVFAIAYVASLFGLVDFSW